MVTYKLYSEEPGETHRLLDTRESGVSVWARLWGGMGVEKGWGLMGSIGYGGWRYEK